MFVSAMMVGFCAFDDLSVTFDDLCVTLDDLSVSCFLEPQEAVPLTLTHGSYHLLSYRTMMTMMFILMLVMVIVMMMVAYLATEVQEHKMLLCAQMSN